MGKVRKKIKFHAKVKGDITKCLPVGARLVCADNTGAKELEIVTVRGSKTRKKQLMVAGIGDLAICSVKQGRPDIKKTLVNAVIIRQKKEYLRGDGSRIKFYDNAAVIITSEGNLKGTEIRGAVAREATSKWSSIAGASTIVI